MRWWLAAAFALVAATSALAVVQVLSSRSEHAFKRYAQDLAAGNAVSAAEILKKSPSRYDLRQQTRALARQRGLSLYVFDNSGRLISDPVSNGIPWAQVPRGRAALAAAVAGGRYVSGSADGDHFAIGLRLRGGLGGELVSYSLRPELRTQLGIVRNEFTASVLWAVLVGAAVGLLDRHPDRAAARPVRASGEGHREWGFLTEREFAVPRRGRQSRPFDRGDADQTEQPRPDARGRAQAARGSARSPSRRGTPRQC